MVAWCKMVAIAGIFFTAVCGLTGCGPANNQPAQLPAVTSETQVQEDNTLFLLGERDFAPISFEENGEVMGIAPDVIREAFKRLGYRVKIQLVPWKRALEMVKDGDADGFFCAYKTPERQNNYTFPAEPIFIERNVFIVRKDSRITFNGDISKLNRYGIGTFIGYNTLDKYIERKLITNIDRSGNIDEALNKLISGDRGVDLVVDTDYIVWYTAKKMNIESKIKELRPPLSENPSYLVFGKKRDRTDLASRFNDELVKIKKDGTYNRIIEKYVGDKKN